MILLNVFELTLPLQNPVLIFSLILFIILFAPLVLNKLRIPYLIGLIIAGAIIGPKGFNLMERDSSIILFGTVGVLYIMFLAGLEIDLADFRKNSKKSLIFGLLTFSIPMTTGTLAGIFILDYTLPTSILLAAMFASHTLVAYPIVSKLGVSKNRAVNITVGGTIITDLLALLVLAVVNGTTSGSPDEFFWQRLGISLIIFSSIVIFLVPLIGRWFFKRFDDSISQYIFVLGVVFFSAFLAEAAGVEPIIGAFLAGLALNRLIPRTSPLMNRIEFVGNALFIPFFLIGAGMLIDFRTFFDDFETIKVAVTMTLLAAFSKYTVAWLTQKSFRFTKDERSLIFGLSSAHVGATLAIVLIGYNIIVGQTADGDPIRLLNDHILNGAIFMILISCTVASFAAQKGARNIALAEAAEMDSGDGGHEERLLIPVNNIENTEELVNLCTVVKSKSQKGGLYALNVINNDNPDASADKKGKKILQKAAVTAAAVDQHLHELLRYDANIVNAISSVVREHKITDLIMGLHHKMNLSDSFLGNLTEGILAKSNCTTLIYKPAQPLSTVQRHLVIVPDRAEKEIGFPFWLIKLWNLARNTGGRLEFYGTEQSLAYISDIHSKHPVDSAFHIFDNWKDFGIISKQARKNDNLVVILSRKEFPSYHHDMSEISSQLNQHFSQHNFMLVYPMQTAVNGNTGMALKDLGTFEPIKELDEIGKTIGKLFRKNR